MAFLTLQHIPKIEGGGGGRAEEKERKGGKKEGREGGGRQKGNLRVRFDVSTANIIASVAGGGVTLAV